MAEEAYDMATVRLIQSPVQTHHREMDCSSVSPNVQRNVLFFRHNIIVQCMRNACAIHRIELSKQLCNLSEPEPENYRIDSQLQCHQPYKFLQILCRLSADILNNKTVHHMRGSPARSCYCAIDIDLWALNLNLVLLFHNLN